MKTTIEKVDISITTKKNSLPTSKAVAGRFRLYEENTKATFVEEESATVIYGESKSRRVLQGKTCSVWWNPEKERYTIRITVAPSKKSSKLMAELDFETCISCIERRMAEE